ncbi:hypothetical protein GQ53DRAFT_818850 [Thozetella sp. PMI_491]|nr:hypothetical protein GQ53DRAFT_818850 [Thozetella sp. PMI_491]
MRGVLLALLSSGGMVAARFCGVVTSPIKSYQDCGVDQFPTMDAECTGVGGTVAGHNAETGNQLANCITYCNDVPAGGHDKRGKTSPYHEDWHLYVVDECGECDYCGPPRS